MIQRLNIMDTLNDYYPLYPQNPSRDNLTGAELEDYNNNINQLNNINRKKPFLFDDWNLKYSDDIWYLWCTINEFTQTANINILDRMTFASFCAMCFENSSKY
jgi:hypothetical protein